MLRINIDTEQVDVKGSGGIAQIVTDMATAISAITSGLLDKQDSETGEKVILDIIQAGCETGIENGMKKSRRWHTHDLP